MLILSLRHSAVHYKKQDIVIPIMLFQSRSTVTCMDCVEQQSRAAFSLATTKHLDLKCEEFIVNLTTMAQNDLVSTAEKASDPTTCVGYCPFSMIYMFSLQINDHRYCINVCGPRRQPNRDLRFRQPWAVLSSQLVQHEHRTNKNT